MIAALSITIRRSPRSYQPVLSDRPAGPGCLQEIKFHASRLIARKDGEQARPWARRGSRHHQYARI